MDSIFYLKINQMQLEHLLMIKGNFLEVKHLILQVLVLIDFLQILDIMKQDQKHLFLILEEDRKIIGLVQHNQVIEKMFKVKIL